MSTALRNGSTVLDSYGYAYDSNGSRTNVLRMNGSQVAYGYDNLGQLTSATGFDPDGSLRGNENFGYLYDPANNLLVRTNNTLVQAFTTDRANELVNVSLENNLLTVVGSLTNHPSSLKINGQNATIYNDLTFAVTNGVAVQSGLNVFTAVVSSGQLMTNSLREVLPASVNLRYDLNGNLVWDGMKGYGYDCANELTSITVTDAWQTKLVYDGFGRRRVKQEYTWSGNGWTKTNEVHYVYDGMTVIQERDANNNPLVSYTRGLDLSGTLQGAGGIGGLLARKDANGITFYHSDGNGNVTMLINSAGTMQAKYLYDSFGNPLGMWGPLAQANTYRFSSMETYDKAGVDLFAYRAYIPNLHRWPNKDPMGERGGLNLYGFVGNSTPNNIDTLGEDIGGFGGGIINENQWTINPPVTPNQVGNPVGMAGLYFFGQGQSEILSPQYMDIVINSPEVQLFKDNLKISAESRMCKTPCGENGRYASPTPLNDGDYHPFSSWTGNWQLYATGETTWHGNSNGSGGCIVSAHESIRGYASKTYTFATTPGGNPWNIVPTVLLVPSVAYITGGGSYFISGDFDIEFDFTHNCTCKNTSQ
jgi:RHS repeat-associated protein